MTHVHELLTSLLHAVALWFRCVFAASISMGPSTRFSLLLSAREELCRCWSIDACAYVLLLWTKTEHCVSSQCCSFITVLHARSLCGTVVAQHMHWPLFEFLRSFQSLSLKHFHHGGLGRMLTATAWLGLAVCSGTAGSKSAIDAGSGSSMCDHAKQNPERATRYRGTTESYRCTCHVFFPNVHAWLDWWYTCISSRRRMCKRCSCSCSCSSSAGVITVLVRSYVPRAVYVSSGYSPWCYRRPVVRLRTVGLIPWRLCCLLRCLVLSID